MHENPTDPATNNPQPAATAPAAGLTSPRSVNEIRISRGLRPIGQQDGVKGAVPFKHGNPYDQPTLAGW